MVAWVTKIFLHADARHGQRAGVLSCVARRTHSFLAGRVHFCGHFHQRHRHHDLRRQEIFRRNFRIRHPSLALADLKRTFDVRCLMFDWFGMAVDHDGNDHFEQLCEIVAKLRAPGGCPWDREQTNESLTAGVDRRGVRSGGCGARQRRCKFSRRTGRSSSAHRDACANRARKPAGSISTM